MSSLETAIRLMVIGQMALFAVVFLSGKGTRSARVSGALLMLGVVGYLFTSDNTLRPGVPLLLPAMSMLALGVPYFIWLFARAIFEAPWPHRAIVIATVIVGLAVWVFQLDDPAQDRFPASTAGTIMRVLALVIVVHALWLSLQGRPDDLIERRRKFRLFFVAVISAQVIAVLIVELVLTGTSPPAWLQLTNAIIIAVLTIGLAIPLLRLNDEFFGPDPQRVSTSAKKVQGAAPSPAESIYRDKLFDLMNGGYYRETGLTISTLAKQLGYPEHQLRKLINGHLGYRNFSAFLNSYRITAAQKELADAERARTPVLTVALDLGYASLGPFNRAFKDTTGLTPTDYRRQNLGQARADSE
jgi:AraC-like DNA-binding protein